MKLGTSFQGKNTGWGFPSA